MPPCPCCRRNIKQYPEARQVDGLLLLRVDAPLFFANVNPVKEALLRHEQRAAAEAAKSGRPLQFIIVDLSPVTDIDASAVHFLIVRPASLPTLLIFLKSEQ